MTITPLTSTGNSSKFQVVAKQGSFMLALSFTLRTKIWQLTGPSVERTAAQDLAEAIVSRHNPKFPFKTIYIFGEHNSEPSLAQTVNLIRKTGF